MDRITTVMSWLEGLTDSDWSHFHSDSEVQNIASEALSLLKEQDEQLRKLQKDMDDIVALLKKQEPVKPISRMEVLETHSGKLHRVYACGKCNTKFREMYGFCPICGQAVKWE